MKLWAALRNAWAGWHLILRADPEWRTRFNLTMPGLVTALALFYVFAFLAIMMASLDVGVPTLEGFLNVMVMQSLWVLALLLAIWLTRLVIPGPVDVLALLVPGLYALIAYLVAGTLISLTIGFALPLLWLVLGFMLFRLGRLAAAWPLGVSVAFAGLSTVLLVGLPMTLYMLATSFAPPAA